MTALDPAAASKFARAALGHVSKEYPNAPQLVMGGPGDLATPHELHPIFYGSFDWHSCVHGHWTLAVLLRLYPDLPEAGAVRAHFDQAFTPEKAAVEAAYFARPLTRGFERPYGWAWVLKLATELRLHEAPWGAALEPLARAMVERFEAFLPKADYPLRAGVHSNTAFALTLSLDYAAAATGDEALAALFRDKARSWYGADVDCQAWEPSGDEFLSSALMEAELMRHILPAEEFRAWFDRFLPRAAQGQPASLFTPVRVSDRSDGKIAHLDGLNLSRAWCWRGIAGALAVDHPLRAVALKTADDHLAASLPHVTGDYMGEHWLASFALLALQVDGPG